MPRAGCRKSQSKLRPLSRHPKANKKYKFQRMPRVGPSGCHKQSLQVLEGGPAAVEALKSEGRIVAAPRLSVRKGGQKGRPFRV